MRTSDVWPQPLRASPSTISSLWARLHGAWRVSSLHAPSIPAGFPRPQRILSLTRCFTTILETNFDTLPSLVHWRFFGILFRNNQAIWITPPKSLSFAHSELLSFIRPGTKVLQSLKQ